MAMPPNAKLLWPVLLSYRQLSVTQGLVWSPFLSGNCTYTHVWVLGDQGCGLGLDVSVSRPSRDILTSWSRLGQSAQRLVLVSVSDLCVSGLVSVSAKKVLASRLGSRTFSSRRDVSCRRAVHDFSSPSPIETSKT